MGRGYAHLDLAERRRIAVSRCSLDGSGTLLVTRPVPFTHPPAATLLSSAFVQWMLVMCHSSRLEPKGVQLCWTELSARADLA